jgi:hypothetical protein
VNVKLVARQDADKTRPCKHARVLPPQGRKAKEQTQAKAEEPAVSVPLLFSFLPHPIVYDAPCPPAPRLRINTASDPSQQSSCLAKPWASLYLLWLFPPTRISLFLPLLEPACSSFPFLRSRNRAPANADHGMEGSPPGSLFRRACRGPMPGWKEPGSEHARPCS